MKKLILLTGASGEVGFETFKELIHRKDLYKIRLLLLDRKDERKRFKPYLDQVEIIWGDIRNYNDVSKAVAETYAIIHLAAIIPPLADENTVLARAVNVGGTKNIIIAAQKQLIPPKIIYTSSVSVYGDRIQNPNIRIGDPLTPSLGDIYARTKIETENMLQASGLPFTIFRLCGILTTTLKIQPLMFHMPLNTTLEWCHASDVAYALVQALENEKVFGRIFNLGGGKQCTVKASEFLQKMFPLYGLSPKTIPFNAFATTNFHSGFYADGNELDDILHFRHKILSEYYTYVHSKVSTIQRFFTRLVPSKIIKSYLASKSEPLQALKDNNTALIERYFRNPPKLIEKQ